jgi:hypothetical protein
MRLTIALSVIGTPHHVTLSFFEPIGKLPKVETYSGFYQEATAIGVEYWEEPDVTVVLLSSPFIDERKKYFERKGYLYEGYEFRAHFTEGSGDLTGSLEDVVGKTFLLGKEYFRVY